MSRDAKSKQRDGVKLPFALRKELGLPDPVESRGERRGRGGSRVADRKQQRQASRFERRGNTLRQQGRREHVRPTLDNNRREDQDEAFESGDGEAEEKEHKLQVQAKPRSVEQAIPTVAPLPKPILKKRKAQVLEVEEPISSHKRASSPGLTLDASSRAFKDRAAEDDADIIALERRLGMKKRKSAAMGDEMLDYLLEGLEGEDDGKKRKREGQDWLESKRRKAEGIDDTSGEDTDEDSDMDELDGLDGFDDDDVSDEDEDEISDREQVVLEVDSDDDEDVDDGGTDDDILGDLPEDESGDEDDFAEFDADDQTAEPVPTKVRENPYIAPVTSGNGTAKYIPPSLRKRDQGSEESLERLKRQVQGHLNKLSEANMISILGEVEKLYRTNPRQDVTTALIDLLLSTFSNPSSLQNTFIILYAAFIAAIYKVMGNDFGAELLCKLVEHFDEKYKDVSAGKEALNLISLLANLFTFGVVSSNIIYEHIRLLLSDFSESNAELLLRVVRDCGPQLRSDDPSALKGIVQMMHDISADLTNRGQQLNIRTRVMMDTITDLKNNKMKNATNAAGMTGEHITRMRKALGTLNSRSLKATEPLRITRVDIENSDKKGKWWLVGASWKGNEPQPNGANGSQNKTIQPDPDDSDLEGEVDFLALAKQYRMNTDVRRSIFVAIMSATDCHDAQMRMLKLRLTNKQEQEIAKVLLRCARAEPTYNPYYALLARNLCKENRKIRIGFQFGLWDFFNQIGEKADNDDDSSNSDSSQTNNDTISTPEIINLARTYAYLIFHNHLDLTILKTLNIPLLKDRATTFLEILLISILTQPKADEDSLLKVFGRTAEIPHVVKGLQYFMRKNVRKSDLVGERERGRVKTGCRVADVAFGMVLSIGLGGGDA